MPRPRPHQEGKGLVTMPMCHHTCRLKPVIWLACTFSRLLTQHNKDIAQESLDPFPSLWGRGQATWAVARLISNNNFIIITLSISIIIICIPVSIGTIQRHRIRSVNWPLSNCLNSILHDKTTFKMRLQLTRHIQEHKQHTALKNQRKIHSYNVTRRFS